MAACSGKVRYPTKPAARRARVAKSTQDERFYAYKCHACGGFHLSTMKRSKVRRARFLQLEEG